MISLFLDTSDKYATVAILKDLEIIYCNSVENVNDLAEKLLVMVEKAFFSVGLTINNVDKIFVVNGPGSFTGIRIGLTFAKVTAYSLNCPIILLSELELLATTNVDKKYIIPLIDARRGYVYTGIYTNKLTSKYPDCYCSYEKIKQLSKEYDDVAFVSYDNFENVVTPKIDIIKIIKKHFNKKGVNFHSANPNYLKKTEAEEKLIKND